MFSLFHKARNVLIKKSPWTLHMGRRASIRLGGLLGHGGIVKVYERTEEGRQSLNNEMVAQTLFGDREWMVPAVRKGPWKLVMPRYPQTQRLDQAAPTMNDSDKRKVANQAMMILWELFCSGYAHRDFHAGNMFWARERLLVNDFETMIQYPPGPMPPFPESYDITGQGLPSPHNTQNMSYCQNHPRALGQLLGVSVADALEPVRESIRAKLREASLFFQARDRRHHCKAQRIYSSFRVPHFEVSRQEAQRDSSRRLERFRIDEKVIRGGKVLDLGCNMGGVLFEVQKFGPASSLGIEYDEDKVRAAEQVVKFAGLKTVRFAVGDVDELTLESLGEPYDTVFCLAIEKHVKKPDQLYRTLAAVTARRLCFEGNQGTDINDVGEQLKQGGFQQIELIGLSDDDCIPENNQRPLLIATKS